MKNILVNKIKFNSIHAKMVLVFAIVAISSTFLCGCQYFEIDEYLEKFGLTDSDYDDSSFLETEDIASEDKEATAEADNIDSDPDKNKPADFDFSSFYRKFFDTDDDGDVKRVREAAGITEESIKKVIRDQEGNYAFDKLTDAGKTLYAELYIIVCNEAEKVYVSTTSEQAIDIVFNYLMTDHPEIFWVDGYNFMKVTVGDVVDKMAFSGQYTYDLKEVAERQKLIDKYVNECISNAPSTDDDYYVIKYIYDYLIANTDYVSGAPDNQNICSVFIGRESVCSGYAKATQYLLNKLGVKCTFVSGTVETRSRKDAKHSWNLVLCNGNYYYMDTTWGDSSYQTTSGETEDKMKLPRVNYEYLCVTTESIESNHKFSDLIALPKCTSMADNYYVRENAYFKSDDLSLVRDLFDRKYMDGSDNVTIKCASEEIYRSLLDKLVTQGGVFEYLRGDANQGNKKSVLYTTFEETRTIIFWL
ncbi:MAG: hypothetical protein J5504_09625 [Butyrivibrio sp.]|nr:hypothetical protein [Butyrivibrio sp.]